MKLAPFIAFIVWCLLGGWTEVAQADYTIRVDYTETPSGVPMGDTILRNGGAILLNYSGLAGQPNSINFSDDRTDRNISVSLFSTPIKISASRASTTQYQDMNVSKVVALRTEISSYARTLTDGTVMSTTLNETFAVNANYNLNVKFGYTATSAAREYQYYFGSSFPDTTGGAPLGAGDFNTTDPNAAIPWSVIAKYGTGSNLVGQVRIVDFGGFYAQTDFFFDIHPTAVPEPGAIWMLGSLGLGLGGRFAWRKWKRRGNKSGSGAGSGKASPAATGETTCSKWAYVLGSES